MNIMYLVGALVLLFILGYPYLMLCLAVNQQGVTMLIGLIISILFFIVLITIIILYKTGIAKMPVLRYMPGRPSRRMMRGMTGYLSGMMTEDENAIEEFIKSLKANPSLYEKFRIKFENNKAE